MGGKPSREVSVGICSRDAEENYRWLQDLLENVMFQRTKVAAHPLYISNNSRAFYDAVARHDFAILYHTRKRGRINIVNVTDSLYDEELKYLHDRLGRKRVVVVIDDLEESSDQEKSRIQGAQTDLQKHACNVLLFSMAEKTEMREKGIHDGEIAKKMKDLKGHIKSARRFKRTSTGGSTISCFGRARTAPEEPEESPPMRRAHP